MRLKPDEKINIKDELQRNLCLTDWQVMAHSSSSSADQTVRPLMYSAKELYDTSTFYVRVVALDEFQNSKEQDPGKKYDYYLNCLRTERDVLKKLGGNGAPRFRTLWRDPNQERVLLVMDEVVGTGTQLDHYQKPGEFHPSKNQIFEKSLILLAALHAQDIVHRDLKPEHIWVSRNPDDFRIDFIDFGYVRSNTFHPGSHNLAFCSRDFAPPEQYLHKNQRGEKDSQEKQIEEINKPSDVFSLSAAFFYWYTGKYYTKYLERPDLYYKEKNIAVKAKQRTEFFKKVRKQLSSKKLSPNVIDALLAGLDPNENTRSTAVEIIQKLQSMPQTSAQPDHTQRIESEIRSSTFKETLSSLLSPINSGAGSGLKILRQKIAATNFYDVWGSLSQWGTQSRIKLIDFINWSVTQLQTLLNALIHWAKSRQDQIENFSYFLIEHNFLTGLLGALWVGLVTQYLLPDNFMRAFLLAVIWLICFLCFGQFQLIIFALGTIVPGVICLTEGSPSGIFWGVGAAVVSVSSLMIEFPNSNYVLIDYPNHMRLQRAFLCLWISFFLPALANWSLPLVPLLIIIVLKREDYAWRFVIGARLISFLGAICTGFIVHPWIDPAYTFYNGIPGFVQTLTQKEFFMAPMLEGILLDAIIWAAFAYMTSRQVNTSSDVYIISFGLVVPAMISGVLLLLLFPVLNLNIGDAIQTTLYCSLIVLGFYAFPHYLWRRAFQENPIS